ncbi:MAG: hypothetical protein HFJ13_11535 [Clostridium sp.]|jgi:hypothetical protein|uniref:hypothetical protein n=1 Tax=Clostridium sp. TaxID=1506 RepID=UPI0025C00019|nr:hypothetical protein [Clostridium sp.]MCI9069874.1 hypothetical protein [Clostridium sp.]MCI9304723.1 hypothetical protein [Clostridium sp.]
MDIIETFISEKEKKEIITNEILRNEAILDEVVSLEIDIENFKGILCENLMYDYFSLDDEVENLKNMCKKFNINFKDVCLTFLENENSVLNNEERNWCNGLIFKESFSIRMNKRLILSKMEASYPSLFNAIKDRANKTINSILKGLIARV